MSIAVSNLRETALDELDREPAIDATHIQVVDGHTVTLTGTVTSYGQKVAAHGATRVAGVQALANEIEVVYPDAPRLGDIVSAGGARHVDNQLVIAG